MHSITIKDQRMKKRQREIDLRSYCMTPPKYSSKAWKHNLTSSYCRDMGYDYSDVVRYQGDIQLIRQMKWQKQQFIYNLHKLLGKHEITKKMTGKDKWKLKQQLQIQIGPNKILKNFKRVDGIIKRHLTQIFWNKLVAYSI